MKVGILTSSRADFGIYIPLLKELFADDYFQTEIIAFGSHLSEKHGKTVDEIIKNNFPIKYQIKTIPSNDTPFAISSAIGETIKIFADFWNKEHFNLVFALGDRYEMFAAVSASVPFNVKIAHIHGGETTLGAIDNSFRHSISLMSKVHFATTEEYKNRIIQLIGDEKEIFNVGALSVDNLSSLKLLTKDEFKKIFKINLEKSSILITFHPETVSYEKNSFYIRELINALTEIKDYQLIITMPNTDTMGNMIREQLNTFISKNENVIGIESFGMLGYLSCMKHCSFMLGNTSSGFVEAAYFPKYVINLGNRQKGRIITPNIFNCEVVKESILERIDFVSKLSLLETFSEYGDGNAAKKIIQILKNSYE